MDNNIAQKDLAKEARLSVNTVYRLTHFGTGTKSIILLIAMVLKYKLNKKNVTEENLTEMLKP